MEAIDATLKEQNTPETPTAYFAALAALLNQAISADTFNQDLAAPVVYLLDLVAPFTPRPLLRAKFTHILSLLAKVLSEPGAEAPLLRSSIGCLESLLLAQDAAAWAMSTSQMSPRRAIAGLLSIAIDPRPKVRKRAQDALKTVLKSPPPSPSLDHPAAAMCASTAMQTLGNLSRKEAQARKAKSPQDLSHDPDRIHALQLVKTIALGSGGWPAKDIEPLCELVLGIARSANEHLTVVVFQIFDVIFEGMAGDEVSSSKLPRLLEIISEMRPAANDTQLLPPWIAVLSRGYDVSGQIQPIETFQALPEPFVMVSQFLASQSKNIRVSASECLVSFMANCVPDQVLLEPSVYDEKVFAKLAEVTDGLLTIHYQEAWMETFTVIGAMFDSLRWRSSPYLLNAVKVIGELRGSEASSAKQEADVVLGKAIRALGPEAVLNVLPLNLAVPARDSPGRAWLLPILRDYTANTNLAHFRKEMVPLSETIFQRILDHGSAQKTMEMKIYETVVQQIWSILPGYCDLPLDLVEAFDQPFAEMLANLLYQQVELRQDVCRALKNLVESNQAITAIEGEEDLVMQNRISTESAATNLQHLSAFSGNLLAVLFNVYSQTGAKTRGPVLQTINAFLSITPSAQLVATFEDVYKMLYPLLQSSPKQTKGKSNGANSHESKVPETSHTLMDLVITLSVYLPRSSYSSLFEIASLALLRDTEPQLQKKAYKLIPRLGESPEGKAALQERHAELQNLLLSSAEKVTTPARRERLAAIAAMIDFVPDGSLHFIPTILREVVIGCKDHNERARTTAFGALVAMGRRMSSAAGSVIDNKKVPNMAADASAVASIEEYFTMVSAGLMGSTPNVISASITALARILYEFRHLLRDDTMAELVQLVDVFLASNNREIVRSVLGFVKVCILSLPTHVIQPRLSKLIPDLMVWSHEHKGHLRAKVKHILERMVRRFGVDAVMEYCPEADRKLITNIRKTKERSKRRKNAAREQGEMDDEDEHAATRTGRFESEYDEALYSSDESDDTGTEDHQEDDRRGSNGTRKSRHGGSAYIVEDPDEPLDLLGRGAFTKISTTRPSKPKRHVSLKAKVGTDGKLVLGREGNGEVEVMDLDEPAHEAEDGVTAYLAALRSEDMPRRGQRGKLKFASGMKSKDDDDNDVEYVADEAVPAPNRAISTRQSGKQNARGGQRGRGRVGSHGRSRGGSRAGGGSRGGRAGKGSIATGRRGLGEGKRHATSSTNGVGKSPRQRR